MARRRHGASSRESVVRDAAGEKKARAVRLLCQGDLMRALNIRSMLSGLAGGCVHLRVDLLVLPPRGAVNDEDLRIVPCGNLFRR
jgi:hypothetical protein